MNLNEAVRISCGISKKDAEYEIEFVLRFLRILRAKGTLRYGHLHDAVCYLGLEPDYIIDILKLL